MERQIGLFPMMRYDAKARRRLHDHLIPVPKKHLIGTHKDCYFAAGVNADANLKPVYFNSPKDEILLFEHVVDHLADPAMIMFNYLVKRLGVKDTVLVFRALSHNNTDVTRVGTYCPMTNVINIDPNHWTGNDQIVHIADTIAHELVHAQQEQEGRYLKLGEYSFLCEDGSVYRSPKKYDYKEYLSRPWEKEAFERAPELAKEALAHLRRVMQGTGKEGPFLSRINSWLKYKFACIFFDDPLSVLIQPKGDS